MSDISKALAAELRPRMAAISCEKKLQEVVDSALSKVRGGFSYQREFQLSPSDVPDFFCERTGVVIEVKKGKAGEGEFRQVGRYLEHDRVTAAIIVSMRAVGAPESLCGKRIATVDLWMIAV